MVNLTFSLHCPFEAKNLTLVNLLLFTASDCFLCFIVDGGTGSQMLTTS